MIIVSGPIHVDPAERDAYLADCTTLIEQARRAPGCLDFHLSADPLEPGRINVYEQWESAADVEAFRGSGPSEEQTATIRSAAVVQHEVASSEAL
ncbi:MAG: antibiotic biosynthesis monooxygenase family protein [Acidimicrobiales bacterium]